LPCDFPHLEKDLEKDYQVALNTKKRERLSRLRKMLLSVDIALRVTLRTCNSRFEVNS
jgi:intein/homing endonuclease